MSSLKEKTRRIIFETDTYLGKLFDLALIILIIFSIVIVMLESVQLYHLKYGTTLRNIEWAITFIFTLEYIVRILCTRNPWRYIFSFYGIVDFLAILPSYLSYFMDGAESLMIIRDIRLLRIFRILKLAQFTGESKKLGNAIKNSWRKIVIFLGGVLTIILIFGTLMYLIEGEQNGFTSIPKSVYWAIVTMTTVGYGDIVPQTIFGQVLSSIIMLTGYGIIAVPTGLVAAKYKGQIEKISNIICFKCQKEGHQEDSVHCRFCGASLKK